MQVPSVRNVVVLAGLAGVSLPCAVWLADWVLAAEEWTGDWMVVSLLTMAAVMAGARLVEGRGRD